MQSDSGLLRWLKLPYLYNVFQAVVGGNALGRRFIQNHIRAKPGDKVIDIGCGPARVLQSLSAVEYFGFDIDPDYIAFARRKYGDKGTFVVGDTRSLRDDSRFKDADIVLAISVLHHLDDEEGADCIRFAYDSLKIGGRLVCYDACWIPNQGVVSKYIMSLDRGRNIRTEQQCRQLAGKIFQNVHAWVDTKPLRIPYVTIVVECEK
jgi:Methylase involved in ubiquinone/menaquinone biosynthesis